MGEHMGKFRSFSACFLSSSGSPQICMASESSLEELSWATTVKTCPVCKCHTLGRYFTSVAKQGRQPKGFTWSEATVGTQGAGNPDAQFLENHPFQEKYILQISSGFAGKDNFHFPWFFWNRFPLVLGNTRQGEEQAQEP